MKYTVRHRVVTDYLRDVEAERVKRKSFRQLRAFLSTDPNETVDLGWTADVEDQDEGVSK